MLANSPRLENYFIEQIGENRGNCVENILLKAQRLKKTHLSPLSVCLPFSYAHIQTWEVTVLHIFCSSRTIFRLSTSCFALCSRELGYEDWLCRTLFLLPFNLVLAKGRWWDTFGKWKENEMRIYMSLTSTIGHHSPKGHRCCVKCLALISGDLRELPVIFTTFPFRL